MNFKLFKKLAIPFLVILLSCLFCIQIINLDKYLLNRTLLQLTNFFGAGNQRHLNYFKAGLFAISDNILHFLFGFGFRNGVRGLQQLPNVNTILPKFGISKEVVYVIESDFVNNYLELGIIGFSLHLFVFITGIIYFYRKLKEYNEIVKKKTIDKIKYLNKEKIVYFCIFCYLMLFFSGIFYSYRDSFWYWLIIVVLPLLVFDEEPINVK